MADFSAWCWATTDSLQPLKLTLERSGNDVLLYGENQGRSVIEFKRVLVCLTYGWGASISYLRPSNFGFENLEQGTWTLLYRFTNTTATSGYAQGEYLEVTGRSVGECTSL